MLESVKTFSKWEAEFRADGLVPIHSAMFSSHLSKVLADPLDMSHACHHFENCDKTTRKPARLAHFHQVHNPLRRP